MSRVQCCALDRVEGDLVACGAESDAWLCREHTSKLERALGDIPALLDDVQTAMLRQARVYRTNRRMREPDQDWRGSANALPATALPINLDAAELLEHARNELTTTVRHLCEGRGAEVPAIRSDALTIATGAARFIHRNIESVRLDEAAGDIYRAITKLRRDLERAVDNTPSRVYAGPCGAMANEVTATEINGTIYTHTVVVKCERDLYRWPTSVVIKCDGYRGDEQGCGAVHGIDERRVWLMGVSEDEWLTLSGLIDISPGLLGFVPPREIVKKWRQRGKLANRADIGEQAQYRVGDWFDLAMRWLDETRRDRRTVAC